jgi:hypothetical protein
MMAVASGKLDTVLTLLEFHADVNAQTNVRNQIMIMMTLIILLIIMLMTIMIVINDEDLDDCYK